MNQKATSIALLLFLALFSALAFTTPTLALTITLDFPPNYAQTLDTTPSFKFTPTGSSSSYNCTLYIDGTNYGEATNIPNNTAAEITLASALSPGDHEWNITCQGVGTAENGTSETRIIGIGGNFSRCAVLIDPGTYKLTGDITDSSASHCINIQANNVILDCQNHKIDGTDASDTYGIYIYRSSAQTTNITVKNCEVSDWHYGIYLYYSSSNTLTNITAYSNGAGIYLWFSNSNTLSNITAYSNYWDGIHLKFSSSNTLTNIIAYSNSNGIYLCAISNSNTLTNITAYSNSWAGIYLWHSNSNTLSNITTYSNGDGIYLYYSSSNTLTNINSTNNAGYDILYKGYAPSDCLATFENVIGTGNKPIVFYNHSVTIKDWNNNVSEIILCNADNSVIDNLTLIGNENNGLLIVGGTENTIVKNSYFRDLEYGIYLYESNSNTLSNITAYSNNYGISLWFSSSNTIKNSKIYSNSQYGIYLYNAGEDGANLIYNNLFNNTNNVYFEDIYSNNWNTTKQAAKNIIGGNYLGGNFWAKPDGTGYSETCEDNDKDGFCDEPYTLATDNVDYLPLAQPSPSFSIVLNSPPDGASTTDQTPDFNFTVTGTESSYSCELFIDSEGYGTATASNSTPTIITANHSLSEGTHNWYVECSARGVTNQSETRTLTVTSAASAQFQIILQKPNSFEILYYNETQRALARVFTSTGTCEVSAKIPRNRFSKLSLTCCSNGLNLYVDSSLVNKTPCSGEIVQASSTLYIGGNSSGYSFKGIIDELHILNTSSYDPTRFYKLSAIIYNPLQVSLQGLYLLAKVSGRSYLEYKDISLSPGSFYVAEMLLPKGKVSIFEVTPKSCPVSVSLENVAICD